MLLHLQMEPPQADQCHRQGRVRQCHRQGRARQHQRSPGAAHDLQDPRPGGGDGGQQQDGRRGDDRRGECGGGAQLLSLKLWLSTVESSLNGPYYLGYIQYSIVHIHPKI